MLGKKVVYGALVLIAGTAICGAAGLAFAADRGEVFTGLVVQPVISPPSWLARMGAFISLTSCRL